MSEDDTIGAVQQAYSTLVRRARLSVVQRRVMTDADVDLDRGAYVVLNRVREWEPVRMSQLADGLMVDISTASRHVSRLEQAGMLGRSPDPDDKRASVLEVTALGVETVDRMNAAWRRALAEVLEDWAEADKRELATLLDRFATDFLKLTE